MVLQWPNGGERIPAESAYEVRWSAFGTGLAVDSAQVETSSDAGRTWNLVAGRLRIDRAWPWRVPSAPGALYRLRVTVGDSLGRTGRDTSDASFAVVAPGATPAPPAEAPETPADESRPDLLATRSVERTTERFLARYREGLRLVRDRRSEEAVEPLRAAIEIDPSRPDAHTALGKVLLDLGRWEEACAALRQGLTVGETPEARVNLGIALLHLESGGAAHAIEELRRALRLAPNLAEAHLYLGMALAESGETGDARESLARAAELAPGSTVARLARAELARRQ